MSAVHFLDAEADYREWLSAHPNGFVLNLRRRHDPSYLVLHRARCHSVSSTKRENYTTTNYRKVCASTAAEIEEWCQESMGAPFRRCGQCKP